VLAVARDVREAALWLRKAADQCRTRNFCMRVLVEGRGVDRDLAEGRRWIARAAEAGMVDAQVVLGEMMLTGTGGACDPPGPWHVRKRRRRTAMWPPCLRPASSMEAFTAVPANHGPPSIGSRGGEHGHPAAQMMLDAPCRRKRCGPSRPG